MRGISCLYILASEQRDAGENRPTAVGKGMKMFLKSFAFYYIVLKIYFEFPKAALEAK